MIAVGAAMFFVLRWRKQKQQKRRSILENGTEKIPRVAGETQTIQILNSRMNNTVMMGAADSNNDVKSHAKLISVQIQQ